MLRASIVIEPPPSLATSTVEASDNKTSALVIFSGRVKLRFLSISTFPPEAKLANFTFALGAVITPLLKVILPPTSAKVASGKTVNPIPSLATELLTISLGLSRKFKPMGALIVSMGASKLLTALNSPSSNKMLSAVLP